jgi:hypothetical protein
MLTLNQYPAILKLIKQRELIEVVDRDLFQDYILCEKDVVMDLTGQVAFTEGERYLTNLQARYINAIDNQGEVHCLGTRYDEDRFFQTHFRILRREEL